MTENPIILEKVEEESYKVDFDIADKYISFSAELLRLSLLAITGVGSFVVLSLSNQYEIQLCPCQRLQFFHSLIGFALASGAALFHRFYAHDALSFQVVFIRKKTSKAKYEWIACLKRAGIALIISEVFFGYAVLRLIYAFYFILL